MNKLSELTREANHRREQFNASLAALSPRMRPERLADDALGQLDPAFKALGSFEDSVRRHPLWALAALAGISRLITGMKLPGNGKLNPSHRPRVRRSIPATAEKESSNGRNDEARLR